MADVILLWPGYPDPTKFCSHSGDRTKIHYKNKMDAMKSIVMSLRYLSSRMDKRAGGLFWYPNHDLDCLNHDAQD